MKQCPLLGGGEEIMCLFKKKEKIVDPIIHEEESNFTLSSGVRSLCHNEYNTCNTLISQYPLII